MNSGASLILSAGPAAAKDLEATKMQVAMNVGSIGTIYTSLATKAPLRNPTFTNNISANGNIGSGTTNPKSSIQACGPLDNNITEQGVHVGNSGNFAGMTIASEPGELAFINFRNNGSSPQAATIQ